MYHILPLIVPFVEPETVVGEGMITRCGVE
jgi:hypothetical protein